MSNLTHQLLHPDQSASVSFDGGNVVVRRTFDGVDVEMFDGEGRVIDEHHQCILRGPTLVRGNGSAQDHVDLPARKYDRAMLVLDRHACVTIEILPHEIELCLYTEDGWLNMTKTYELPLRDPSPELGR
jgi:hypothetical protein